MAWFGMDTVTRKGHVAVAIAFLKAPEAVRPSIRPEPLHGREEKEGSRRVSQNIEGAIVLVLSSFTVASATKTLTQRVSASFPGVYGGPRLGPAHDAL